MGDAVGGKYFKRDNKIHANGNYFCTFFFYITQKHITNRAVQGGRLVGGKFPIPSVYTTHYLTLTFSSPKLFFIL